MFGRKKQSPWEALTQFPQLQLKPKRPPFTGPGVVGEYQGYHLELLEKPGKPLVFRQGMKGQNLSFIISSMGLFFKKNPIER